MTPIRRERRLRQQGGYTLIEVLVVLTITAMVSTVLMQALAQVYDIERRLGRQLQSSQGDAMQVDWFRQIVQELQPDVPEGPGRLRGDARNFESLGLNPMADDPGIPQQMSLSLKTKGEYTQLLLHGDKSDLLLAEWDDLSDARFVYQDAAGESHDSWPPPLGKWPSLPTVIQLRIKQGGVESFVTGVPRSNYEPFKPSANALEVHP